MSTCSIDRRNAVFLLLSLCWPVGPQSQRKEEEKRDALVEIVRGTYG
jgi:hypothetical protein